MSADYVKPDWCETSTWERAKALVFKLVPESLMSRTGQRRIEMAALAIQENKGRPVLWGLVFAESYGLNEMTTFKTYEKAKDYSDRCSPKPRVVPLYEVESAPLGGEWEATPQIGRPGHCSLAQVFRNGRSVASFDATYDPNEASAMALALAEVMASRGEHFKSDITSDDIIDAMGLTK